MTVKPKLPSARTPEADRRLVLRTLGLGALAAVTDSVITIPAMAQTQTQTQAPAASGSGARIELKAVPKKVPLGKLEAAQRDALKLAWAVPDSTPIAELGLTARGVKALTPAARELTKADLEALGRGDLGNSKVANLTIEDVGSIGKAFGQFYKPGSVQLLPRCHCCCGCAKL